MDQIPRCNTLAQSLLYSVNQLLQTMPVHSNLFEYKLVNENACERNNTEIDLLIFITSNSSSYERRSAIRRTYGNLNHIFKYTHDTSTRLEIRILFMINLNENRMQSIQFEQHVFHDIVQVLIPEDNLMNVYRDLAILDWSSKYCSQARFILKMDDTVFLNPFLLLKFINENQNDRMKLEVQEPFHLTHSCPILDARLPLLYGFIHSHVDVLRPKQINSQQRKNLVVDKDEYPCDVYPTYLNDHAYLISNDARDLILCTFSRQSNLLLTIPSIYITGILPEYLHIERQSLWNYQINSDSDMSCERFFTRTHSRQAFACITDRDFSDNIFERYSLYWQILIHAQMETNEK